MELINTKITKPRYRYEGRGGIYLGVVDFDKEYYKNSNHSLVVNDLDITTAAGKETFRNLVYTRHDGDIFSDVPTCPCGTMRGGHLIGMICQTCNNPCTPLTERSLEPIIWMRSLHDKVKFMNIQIYTQLRHVWNKGGFSVLDYLIDPKYVPKDLNLQGQLACEALNLPRGLKAFEENFDEIIEILLTARLRLPRNGVETMFSFTQRKDVDDLRIHKQI